jgi:competence protein ComEC
MRALVAALLAASLVLLALACEEEEAETPTPAITVTATPRATHTPKATLTPAATPTPTVTATPEATPEATPSPPAETPTPSPPLPWPTPTTFAAHFIDVGQGDAILIEADGTVILLDGGDASANVEDYLQVQGIQDIDLMVATHPHEDHIGGLIDVLALYDVHEIWTSGATHASQTYQNFAAAVTDEGATKRDVSRGYSAQMGALEIDVLHPRPPLTGNLPQDSLVLYVSCGQLDVLLTGDATTGSEARMLAAGVLGDVEVLKVGHHGSNTSTSDAFLTAVTPEDAVISVGTGNTYGHPHQETLDRLAAAGVTVYRTDLDGTVVLTSDCNTYSITTSDRPGP